MPANLQIVAPVVVTSGVAAIATPVRLRHVVLVVVLVLLVLSVSWTMPLALVVPAGK